MTRPLPAVIPLDTTLAPAAVISAREALRRAAPLLALRPLLVVSDFDGTLSPIVMDPWGASVLPAAQRALRRLAGVADVHVAILSGRTASDVAARTRIGGASYLGNHGVERGRLGRRQRPGSMAIEIFAVPDRYAQAAERVATGIPALIPDAWLVVERKTPAVSLHFRSAPDVDAAARPRQDEVVDQRAVACERLSADPRRAGLEVINGQLGNEPLRLANERGWTERVS